jgi:hypothetical protein
MDDVICRRWFVEHRRLELDRIGLDWHRPHGHRAFFLRPQWLVGPTGG